jgi:hypothetical protein
MNKLKVIASLSGGGKSTYATENYHSSYVLPDTNVKAYEIYHKLFRGPALEQGLEPDKLTGLTLWTAKHAADIAYLKAVKTFGYGAYEENEEYWEFLNMRSGWDFLIYDELWQKRNIISEELMYDQIKEIESQFNEVEYEIWVMRDQEIIKELMARNDDRSNLFNNDPVEYNRWQDYYVSRYESIMKKFNYNYLIKEVTYR